MALLSGITGALDKYVLGYALGTAAGPSLEPFVQDLANEAWTLNPVKPPTVYTLVRGVAEGHIPDATAREWAHQQGIGDEAFDALVATSHSAPEAGSLFEAWRRGLLTQAEFDTGLTRHGIEQEWWPALHGLRRVLLSPAEAANARQQGFISDSEQVTIAGEQGLTAPDAEVQYELAGLPPGIETALQMLRRGIIDEATFRQIVREGHTKTKYTDDLLAIKTRILTAQQAVDAHVRGWITKQEMYQRGALEGFAQPEMDLLFDIHGRPLSWHQIFIGLRRGGTYDGATGDIDPAFLKGLRESDIRPEWYNLAWAQRFTYPTAFVLRTLTQDGDITEQQAHDILLFEGWEPSLAATVSAKWATPAGAKADPWVGKANTQLYTATHKAYKGNGITAQQAQQAFDLIGIAAGAQAEVLTRWDLEKTL